MRFSVHTSVDDLRSSLAGSLANGDLRAGDLDDLEAQEKASGAPRSSILALLQSFRKKLARVKSGAAAMDAMQKSLAPQLPAAAVPEVLPAKRGVGRPESASTEIGYSDLGAPQGGSNVTRCDTFESLPELETILALEIEEWKALEQQAAFRGLRIGVLILKARADLKHGQFIPWARSTLPFSRMTVWRFARCAEVFLQQKRLGIDVAYSEIAPKLVQGVPQTAPPDMTSRSVQLAFDFVGARTFSELCDDLGMPMRRNPGGDHGGGKARADKLRNMDFTEVEKTIANDQFEHVLQELSEFVQKKRFVHVHPATLTAGRLRLKECVKALEE